MTPAVRGWSPVIMMGRMDLDQVDRIDVGIAHVDRSTQDSVVGQQLLAPGDFEDRRDGLVEPSAEVLADRQEIRRHQLTIVFGRNA